MERKTADPFAFDVVSSDDEKPRPPRIGPGGVILQEKKLLEPLEGTGWHNPYFVK